MIPSLLLAAVLAQASSAETSAKAAPTGYLSAFFDHVPNREATELRARGFVEEKADVGSRLRVAASAFVEALAADRGRNVTDVVAEPQELNVTFRAKRLDVTAGLGRVVWGRLDELQPTDVVNPLDLSRFFFEGRSEARLSVPLARAVLYARSNVSVEGVYVPFFRRGRFDRLDEPSSPFNIAPAVPFTDRTPARTAANGQGGARVNLTTGRVDWSVSAYRGFRTFGMYSASSAFSIDRIYPRFTMVGGDFEAVAGAWVVRGETAVFVRDAFQADSAAVVLTGQSFDAGIGLDRKAGSYRVSGQVLVHREDYDREPRLPDVSGARLDVSLIASADRSFARQKYDTRLFGVYDPNNGSGFLRGIVTAKLRDDLALEGSLGWFSGRGPDTIGRFSDSDFGYVRLKYFF
jgi:hypothetical protein